MYINDQTQIYFKAGGPHRLALKPLMYTANSYECIEKYFFGFQATSQMLQLTPSVWKN